MQHRHGCAFGVAQAAVARAAGRLLPMAALVDMDNETARFLARQVVHGGLMQLTDIHAVVLAVSKGVAPARCLEPINNGMQNRRVDVWPNKLRARDAEASGSTAPSSS